MKRKIVKIVLIVLVTIIAVIWVAALLIPKSYHIEREITINRPKVEVFEYLKSLRNQNEFSVWARIDPQMRYKLRGAEGTVGFVSAWESDNKDVGKGEQEIKNIVAGERIDCEIRFLEPFKSVKKTFMATSAPDSASTLVVWGFDGRVSYPLNLLLLFMNMEHMVENDLQKGLENLKTLLEEKKFLTNLVPLKSIWIRFRMSEKRHSPNSGRPYWRIYHLVFMSKSVMG